MLVDNVQNSLENRELKVEKKIDIQLFIDHVYKNESTLTEILKTGFSKESRRRIYRIQNRRIISRYFNEFRIMKRAHFGELIGSKNNQEMMDSLQDHILSILSKEILPDIKPVRFCPQIYWVMVAVLTIVWMFLEENKYIKKETLDKFITTYGYYHIAKLDCASVLLTLTSVLDL